MKQEIKLHILSFILTLFLTLCFCFAVYLLKTSNSYINLLLDKIDGVECHFSPCTHDGFEDKIEELTRENVVLRQTVADQAIQIREFGWLKPQMDKEGINP